MKASVVGAKGSSQVLVIVGCKVTIQPTSRKLEVFFDLLAKRPESGLVFSRFVEVPTICSHIGRFSVRRRIVRSFRGFNLLAVLDAQEPVRVRQKNEAQ